MSQKKARDLDPAPATKTPGAAPKALLGAALLLVLSPFGGLLAAGLVGCQGPTEGPERGQALYANCAPCHGQAGEGNEQFSAPAIAGMSDWYLRRQLEHFQIGARGAHAEDAEGLRMRAMVRTLRTEADLEEVVAYVSSLPPVDPASSLEGGDVSHGEELFTATCTECHGEGAQGNEERNAPPLNRASDWYLERQIMKFRAGVRGADPRDETGAQMRPMATSLPDDQAVRDVVAYISSLD